MKISIRRTGNTVVIWPAMIFLFMLVTPSFFGANINNIDPPPMELIIKWNSPSDTLFLTRLRKDADLCCNFSFKTIKSDSCVTEIRSRDGVSIGFIYGSVSSGFLKNLVPSLETSLNDFRRTRTASSDYSLPPTKLQTELKTFE
jgi:hypothetical protein